MTPASATALAEWLARNEPSLFSALEREAAVQSAKLNGITDFLKTVGTSITTGVKAVGSYLASPAGMDTLTGLGTAYLGYKQQQNVLQTQIALAQAGMPMAPIQNTTGANGQTIPVYTPTNQVATNDLLYQLQPTFFQRYKWPLIAGGAGVILLLALR